MRNFHAIPKSLQVVVACKCSISRHYRTFIQKPANSGVQWVLACESVTAAYLNTNQDRPTKIFRPRHGESVPRPPPPKDCTHGQCPQDPDRGRRYRSARYVGGAVVAARRI